MRPFHSTRAYTCLMLILLCPLMLTGFAAVFIFWRMRKLTRPGRNTRGLREDFRRVIGRNYSDSELAQIKKLTDCFHEWR